MKWYTKYLSVFEKPIDEAPQSLIEEIRIKLKQIQSAEPLVSVVVIAYNEENRLLSCLWSLADSATKFPIEIIGVDNDSNDRTASIFGMLEVPYYTELRKSGGNARNRGQMEAKGKYYICIDSDTIYPSNYIDYHIKYLSKNNIVATSSLWSYVPDKNYPRFRMVLYEFLRDVHLIFQSIKRPELCVRGMTFAYKTELGKKVGYRLDIRRGEDGSMALGLKKYGKIKLIISNKARVFTSTGTLKQDGTAMNALKVRIVKSLKNIGGYFVKKESYKDEDSNLVK